MATSIKTISVSLEFDKLARDNGVSWSEAARVGISVILGERGIQPYDNKLNLYRKMIRFKTMAEETLNRLSELEADEEINGSIVPENKIQLDNEQEVQQNGISRNQSN
jgi:hypothetical protein